MLVQNLIDQITLEAGDLLDTPTDAIQYINAASDYLSFVLIGMKSSDCMRTVDVVDNLPVPSDFVEMVPQSGYPVYIDNDTFYTNGATVKVKYSISKPHVSQVTDVIPWKDMYASVLVLIASYMIEKKSYIPASKTERDKPFYQDVLAAIAKAKGAA